MVLPDTLAHLVYPTLQSLLGLRYYLIYVWVWSYSNCVQENLDLCIHITIIDLYIEVSMDDDVIVWRQNIY